MVPFVQDFFTQEKLAGHAPDKLLFTVYCIRREFTILDISLDIVVLWLSIGFNFDTHAFFDVHAIDWNAMDFYVQVPYIISF